ncbi:MAG: 2-isopropylmalate synthase [Chroococcopsis gigantea SAG 12.99]|jgi:2-isopropylmalate synthase|nr:2-isopropylmalate synthase [Chroococcopsis gigantea SAG 12.99]
MSSSPSPRKITIFDTTMRDGEMSPNVKFTIPQKVQLAQLLERMGVDVIEVGYPGMFEKDLDEVKAVAERIKNPIVCGLAGSKQEEIEKLASCLGKASRGRINVFTNVHLAQQSQVIQQDVLSVIGSSVSLARRYCPDVQWSAFDAIRSEPDFLCLAVETAIKSGAGTITIPDTLGTIAPGEFVEFLKTLIDRVPNIERATLAVHCHDDSGYAVENSLAALGCGVGQIECSINGLGARRGNADLRKIVQEVSKEQKHLVNVDMTLLDEAEVLVAEMTAR